MNAKLEVEKLKNEFVALNSETERIEFDKKFKANYAAKTDAEKQVFAKVFVENAKKSIERTKSIIDYVEMQLKINELNTFPFALNDVGAKWQNTTHSFA